MAKTNSKQQSSQVKKLLLLGGGLVVIILIAFPASSPSPTSNVKKTTTTSTSSKVKKDSLLTPEDDTAKFEAVGASIKNGFDPLVKKSDGVETAKNAVPFTDGDGNWVYTGNMVVNGTPNALLENTATGDGVFLRPGQSWKSLRLIAVKEDSIEVEGPNGDRKTVFFEDKGMEVAPQTSLQPLPPATIQGNIPNGANPQINQPGGNQRRGRGPQADQSNPEALVGTIGSPNFLESSIDDQPNTNNSNTNGNNRRIRRNQ